MAMWLVESVVGALALIMLGLFIFLIVLLVCKPSRLFSFRSHTIKGDKKKRVFSGWSTKNSFLCTFFRFSKAGVGDLERPLVSNDGEPHDQTNEPTRNYDIEGACYQNEGLVRLPRTQGPACKQRLPPAAPHLAQGDSLILEVVSDPLEDISIGQTLKRPFGADLFAETRKHIRQEVESPQSISGLESDVLREIVPKVITDQRSCLSLEVISGPSRGLRCSVQSSSASRLPLTLGRVSSDLLLKDSEVSGRHAMVNWNADKKKWELVDMGSLNGTLLNSQPVGHPDSGSRNWGDPVELSNADVITLGTTSKVYVHVTHTSESQTPFGVGVASNPMSLRRGGKKLAMEDVCYYQWPFPGIEQFGIFGICDGHGGVAAANTASKMLPEKVVNILSDSLVRQRILSQCDASDVLRVAFSQTEASMNNYYEGCTATLLLVWADGKESFFVQCANVGDSACIINVDGKQIKMTEDHRITSPSERLRINELGEPLKDGETRLCGLNLARMLGDKYLKQQDARFSSEPFISQAVHIDQASSAFALLASDGFWDVISVKKAVQLVFQMKERSSEGENTAQKVANFLLSEAKSQRTKDNTSIIFLDFDKDSRASSCKVDS